MTTSEKPQKLEFNNVISMGVSYSWENIAGEGNTNACSDIVKGENLVKRTKNVSLDVLNLDLTNAGDSVINFMANNQSKYVAGDLVDIHANGVYAGNGKLTNYAIKEGGQSNAVVTNLNYEMVNGGPDDTEDLDKPENPIERNETITVSRDIQGNTYTIEHTYAVNFGNEFNLVTDHPAYANDPTYASASARLSMAASEANKSFQSPISYGNYINLDGYATKEGWDLEMLKENCMGAYSTSSETRDYINGNYSKTLTQILRYTGKDIDKSDTNPYEIEYTMSFQSQEFEADDETTTCAVATMEGVVRNTAGPLFSRCGEEIGPSDAAQSGYDRFVQNGKAKGILKNWFNAIAPKAGITENLNNVMVNSTTKVCVPNVQKGNAKNDGTIKFSFEMNNCPGEKETEQDENGNSYPYSESITENYSFSTQKDCDDVTQDVTTSTINKSVSATSSCILNIDEDGKYPLFDSISSVNGPSDPAYIGDRPKDNKIRSESSSSSPYQGSKSWSITYSDAINTDNCQKRPNSGQCYSFNVQSNRKAATDRIVSQATANGIQTQTQGTNAPQKSISLNLNVQQDCAGILLDNLKDEAVSILNKNAPSCIITSLNWSYSEGQGEQPSMQVSVEGRDG